ncbi:RagB/SusD family nutrient uptake outer membrane protein [Chitinophaga sp. CF118]|uniref:RagB/SusD family nutrient uptake outer membrane protein n=1 Tax=Chitinophaga sp. CF118 TaxID=1884367 RepID=UPI0015A4EFC8|nr:RagB/SusD family nutrient uptake outer membrane protein [Chitinophaga sp. CF118]
MGLLLVSCNKKLDVKPQDSISPDQVKTEADVTALLFGTYDGLQYYRAYGEQYQLISDLIANEDDISFVGTFADYKLVTSRQQNRTSIIAEGIWQNGFEIINKINIVLSKLDLVADDNKAAVGAEAKCIRAIIYYMLSGFYGKPYSDGNLTTNLTVPLVVDPIISTGEIDKAYVARATVQDMYTQIETDLKAAIDGLPEDNGTRANKYTAYAYLARLYMAEAKYTAAATAANEIIEKGPYSLTTSYAGAFNNASNSSEDIFAIQQTEQSNTGVANNGIITMYNAYPDGRGDAQVNVAHLDLYEGDDERGKFFYNGSSIAGKSGIYTTKYSTKYKVVPIVRLAEIYLTRGEANLRGGVQIGSSTPLEDINTIRERSGASTLLTVTGDDFVTERYRELAFEGDKFWTKKRLKLNIGSLAYDNDQFVLPIPERETDVNKLLEQNNGY